MNAIEKAVLRFERAVRNHENLGMYRPEEQVELEMEFSAAKDNLMKVIANGGHITLKMNVWEFLIKFGSLELKGIIDEAPIDAEEFFFDIQTGDTYFFKGLNQKAVYGSGTMEWVEQVNGQPIIEPDWICSITESKTVIATL